MNMHLVVVRPFGGLARGDTIVDPKLIAELLRGEHVADVVRVSTNPMAAGARKED